MGFETGVLDVNGDHVMVGTSDGLGCPQCSFEKVQVASIKCSILL